ncbi:class II aaRS and biotin synthetase [Macrolepiota fuliginosa MF-IS2]|uniref:Class II aaRS and biotin synthetase n=1 Tax=Macrolepiota fuliginosa MF-IS2 TaxID=1400762 RepID=A0A9P5XMN8_9AGAR|nr:class II aaRS and biotin synthetase [Macrolepiota fuliginosa MF-IS2]
MNVLVYNGPEVVHASFNAVLNSLRTILLPHYSVQQVELSALAKQPWSSTCALLVFPRLEQPFQAPAHTRIQDYVERGGAFLAFGAGASCSTRGLVTGMEHLNIGIGATNASSLKFFDKFSNAYIRPTFGSSPSDASPSLVKLEALDRNTIRAVYEAARAEFTGFQDERGIKILGRYDNGEIAGLGCDVGIGRIALWSPNLEVPLTEEPASALVSPSRDNKELDKDRRKLLKRTIIYLGLQLPTTSDPSSIAEPHVIARPFPQFLVSSPDRPHIVSQIIDALSDSFTPDEPKILKDSNDTLYIHESTSTSTSTLLEESKAQLTTPSDPSTWQPKHIVIHRDGTLPSTSYTSPYFSLSNYFNHIASLHQSTEQPTDENKWPIGSALFFSPAVTSTQTLLDKNPIFLTSLPTPIVSLASHQLSARGRGSNVWLSPSGSLSYSIHLRLTAADGVPWGKLVFVQYLFALAVCEGVRDKSVLGKGGGEGGEGEGSRIRIKWPNDVYALVGPRGAEEKKKVAGILVNTNFGSRGVDIVIGCGLNIFNDPPSTSLAHLLRNTRSGNKLRENLSIERTAAVILFKFEEMWTTFISSQGSFEPFMDLYLKRWLHSYVVPDFIPLNSSIHSSDIQRSTCNVNNNLPAYPSPYRGYNSRPRSVTDYT